MELKEILEFISREIDEHRRMFECEGNITSDEYWAVYFMLMKKLDKLLENTENTENTVETTSSDEYCYTCKKLINREAGDRCPYCDESDEQLESKNLEYLK